MTFPPPATPGGSHRARPRQSGAAPVTRIVRTDELPPGVDALASADGKTIIVRASLDPLSSRRAMREVLASGRRFPRLALYPALSLAAIRQVERRVVTALSSSSQTVQQVASNAAEHMRGLAVAVTAAAGTAAVVTAVVVTATPAPGAGSCRTGGHHPDPPAATNQHRISRVHLPATPLHYLGVYVDGVPDSYQPVVDFGANVGVTPNIALYYSSWNEKFKLAFAEQAYQDGATPAVQIEPFTASMAAIAAGKYDAYLDQFADAVVDYGHPVIIGFAHEPDGDWYPWGAPNVTPATWTAAWKHVVDVFRSQGADNVTWLWTVNSQGPEADMAAAWWPGPGYVTWIGVDGYFANPGDTFASVFGPILSVVSGFDKPVLISETAVGPGTHHQVLGINDLFAGLRAKRLLGLIWFDQDQDSGEFHQDWRLEGSRAATAAFRADAGSIHS
jgi:mannan endo-1,4-beta-mannosidase